jgi:hypothetical protein
MYEKDFIRYVVGLTLRQPDETAKMIMGIYIFPFKGLLKKILKSLSLHVFTLTKYLDEIFDLIVKLLS